MTLPNPSPRVVQRGTPVRRAVLATPVPVTPTSPVPPPVPVTERRPEDSKQGTWPVFLHVVMGITLGILGLNMVVGVFVGLVIMFLPESELAQEFRELIGIGLPTWGGVAFSFVAMGVVPVVWLLGTRVEPVRGTLTFLHLRFGLGWVWRGLALLGGMALAWLLLVFVSQFFPAEPADEELLREGIRSLTWPLIIAMSITAGVTEEILFRGILFRWLQWWGQALVFCAAHFAAGNPWQIGFTLVVGLVFGWLRLRGWSLLSMMIAHTLYDIGVLSVLKVFGDAMFG